MKKEDINRLIESHNCIPGVYNYCDRWCERCPLTSRCLNYLMVDEHFGSDAEKYDLTNEVFWQKLSEMLKLTLDMVRETAQEMGVDLDDLIDGPETDSFDPGERVVIHVIEHQAKVYGGLVDDWFENDSPGLEEQQPRSHLKLHDPKGQEDDVRAADAVEVIRWYQYQIYIKICRALSTDNEEDDADDANGSAKVALIGIDRSISAWGVLLKLFPDNRSKIVPLVKLLENLRNRVDSEIPKARNFQRPGFDSKVN